MNEELIQFSWKFRLYKTLNLRTLDNQPIEVIDPGLWNRDSGPDFFNAKVKIDTTIWVGNIEIHKDASEWYQHKHHLDPAYNNVVLHVVLSGKQNVANERQEAIPTLILPLYDYVIKNYEHIKSTRNGLPCQQRIKELSPIFMHDWLTNLLMERLHQKVRAISQDNDKNKHHWELTFHQSLFKSFGSNKNSLPFELLAKSIPQGVLNKYSHAPKQLEALLFGQAGFLNDLINEDDYVMALAQEYRFIAAKHNLVPIQSHLWKFLRLRPMNFPTVRIAQLAGLLSSRQHLLSRSLECETLNSLQELYFSWPSRYWDTHYQFNKASLYKKKSIGTSTINTIIINTIVPFTFAWGKEHGNNNYCTKALHWLEILKAEKNHIVDAWHQLGYEAQNAFDSQALIQLNNSYCITKNCIRCRIGHQIIAKPLE